MDTECRGRRLKAVFVAPKTKYPTVELLGEEGGEVTRANQQNADSAMKIYQRFASDIVPHHPEVRGTEYLYGTIWKTFYTVPFE